MELRERSVSLYAAGAQNVAHLDRGIPRYIVEHLRALDNSFGRALHSVLLDQRRPLTGNLNWLLGSGLLSYNRDRLAVGARSEHQAPCIYHVMSPFELDTTIDVMWPSWARSPDVSTVVTVYDLIPLIFPDHYLPEAWGRVEYQTRADFIRHVDGVLAISRATAADVVTRLGVPEERVYVINAGATDIFGPMFDSGEQAERHLAVHHRTIRPGFLLYVGGYEFRKNLDRLIDGYALLDASVRSAHQLVIACRVSPEQVDQLQSRGRDRGLEEGQLHLTGYISDADLGALYHACELFVFPSLYEGSGLPILEAMLCGAPVIASSTSTGPEILGGGDATFDPGSPEAIAACVGRFLGAPAELAALRERSLERVGEYTWRNVARDTSRAYESVLERRAARPSRRRRRRIALVTPWPLERSGIADYNLRLAAALGQRVDVDIVVSEPVEHHPAPEEESVRLVGAEEFDRSRGSRPVDRILYAMGNSHFHRHVHHLLRRHPGSVVFHDVRITGFYGWLSGVERPEDPSARLGEWIRGLYGSRMPPQVSSSQVPSWREQLAMGIYMTREIQQYAEQCFVHSEMSRAVLELDRGVEDRAVPITVVPFGMPSIVDRTGRPPSDPDESLVVSMGYVHEVKGLEALIRAFGLLAARRPRTKLVIAGPKDDAEHRRWSACAAEHAAGAQIEIPGEVDEARYRELLERADLAVQLRRISNGEASAAVADCLAAGVPTIVSDIGWLGALPAEAAAKVPLEVGPDRLAAEMERVITDQEVRSTLTSGAQALASASAFGRVADAYLEALEL
jgi:glycosyltransferase involved in cell wall biosynthesis